MYTRTLCVTLTRIEIHCRTCLAACVRVRSRQFALQTQQTKHFWILFFFSICGKCQCFSSSFSSIYFSLQLLLNGIHNLLTISGDKRWITGISGDPILRTRMTLRLVRLEDITLRQGRTHRTHTQTDINHFAKQISHKLNPFNGWCCYQ